MATDISFVAAMKKRSSWRSYDGRTLAPEDKAALEASLGADGVPFGNGVRFALLAAAADYREELKALGTYGTVAGARAFVAGAVVAGPMDMEDYGFALERVVLRAAAMGLGTCWLGASFSRSGFARAIGLKDDEILPAVTPVGYPARTRTLVDKVTRLGAASDRRKPWEELFSDGGFGRPLTAADAGPYAEVLEMVRLAPSASNRQPWRLVRLGGAFHLFLRRTPMYDRPAFNAPGGDLQRLDMGIAICHFELAARELGLPGAWRVSPEPPVAGALPPRTFYIASWLAS